MYGDFEREHDVYGDSEREHNVYGGFEREQVLQGRAPLRPNGWVALPADRLLSPEAVHRVDP